MIVSFRGKTAALLYQGRRPKGFPPDVFPAARRKLVAIDAAAALGDLAAIRGNRLEALAGDRRGQYSIRINDQFRICFRWSERGPEDVEVVDYHRAENRYGAQGQDKRPIAAHASGRDAA